MSSVTSLRHWLVPGSDDVMFSTTADDQKTKTLKTITELETLETLLIIIE